MAISPAIVIHIASVVPALILGGWQLCARKGDKQHRFIGRFWMTLMTTGAISSFWILEVNPGHFSWIHGLSLFTLFSIGWSLYAIRKGNIVAHRRSAIGAYIGLWAAFGGALFVPGRLLSLF